MVKGFVTSDSVQSRWRNRNDGFDRLFQHFFSTLHFVPRSRSYQWKSKSGQNCVHDGNDDGVRCVRPSAKSTGSFTTWI